MLFDQDIILPETLVTDALSVKLMGERLRYSLRVKAADVTTFGTLTGVKLPAKIGATKITKNRTIAKLGPDEWIVIADAGEAKPLTEGFSKAAGDLVCSVTEVSHRNVGFMLTGPDAVSAVNIGCALDLRLEAFPVGKAARTTFENAPILLIRTGEQAFQIECWRSFGPYMRDFLAKFADHRQSALA